MPLATQVTAANVPDVQVALALVDAIPAIGGRVGAPVRKPGQVTGEKGYDAEWLRIGCWTIRLQYRGRELQWKELPQRPARKKVARPKTVAISKAVKKPWADHPWRKIRAVV